MTPPWEPQRVCQKGKRTLRTAFLCSDSFVLNVSGGFRTCRVFPESFRNKETSQTLRIHLSLKSQFQEDVPFEAEVFFCRARRHGRHSGDARRLCSRFQETRILRCVLAALRFPLNAGVRTLVRLPPQTAWSPSCPASTWPTRCASRSRTCSTGSTGRRWASSTPSKCLTRGSRTTRTRSSSRASRPASPSGSPAPSAPRTWRGSWRSPTRSASPSPGLKAAVRERRLPRLTPATRLPFYP